MSHLKYYITFSILGKRKRSINQLTDSVVRIQTNSISTPGISGSLWIRIPIVI